MYEITEQHIKKIESNWGIFIDLVGRIEDESLKISMQRLCNEIHERLSVCPASTQYTASYEGGIVELNLKTLKIAKDLNVVYGANVSMDSLIVVCLFYNLGKIGNEKEDLYLVQDSQWHRERGMNFTINKHIANIPFPVRTIWWLTKYGVGLSEDELYAISSMQDMARTEIHMNELYQSPMLAVILQNATRVANINNADKKSVLG